MEIHTELDSNICRLCFEKEGDLIEIFGEQGTSQGISAILSKYLVFLVRVPYFFATSGYQRHVKFQSLKHFFFVDFIQALETKLPTVDTRKICETCWTKTWDFHLFYTNIYDIHQNWLATLKHANVKCEYPEVDFILPEKLETNDAYDDAIENGSMYDGDGGTEPIDFKEFDEYDDAIDELSIAKPKRKSSPKKRKPVESARKSIKRERDDDIDWENYRASDDEVMDEKRRRPPQKKAKAKATVTPKETITKAALTFFDDAIIDAYMKDHPFTCEICYVRLETFAAAKTHHRSEHHQKGYIVCCGTKYFRRDRAIDHIGRHNGVASNDQYM